MEKTITCPTCKSDYKSQPNNCSKCGYPFSGTEMERSKFVGQQILKKRNVSDTKDNIKRARIILWIIGGINIFFSFLSYQDFSLIIGIFLGVIFIGFGFLTYRKPFISIITPLILLVLFYAASAIQDPSSLIQGVLWKIVILASLTYALVGIIKSEKIRKESDFLREQSF